MHVISLRALFLHAFGNWKLKKRTILRRLISYIANIRIVAAVSIEYLISQHHMINMW